MAWCVFHPPHCAHSAAVAHGVGLAQMRGNRKMAHTNSVAHSAGRVTTAGGRHELFEGRVPQRMSSTCVEHVATAEPPSTSQDAGDAIALARLHEREAQLLEQLKVMGAAIDSAEEAAHGVLRVDPPEPSTDGPDDHLIALRARAHARVEEWAALYGGGRITLSQVLSLPPSAPSARAACECRREGWVVQLYAAPRRIQVAAVRLSALPPDGRTCQVIDCTWLDAVDASDGIHHGLPRLLSFVAAVGPKADEYDYVPLRDSASRLALPPLDHVHVSMQPLVLAGGEACAPLARLLAAVGAEMSAWARLEDPLPKADDAAIDALHYSRLHPPRAPHGGARSDLAVAWWARIDLYLASAMLLHAELGLRPWLQDGNTSLRAYPLNDSQEDPSPDSTTPLSLILRVQRHPRADDARRMRVAKLLGWLCGAPAPLGPHIAEVVAAAGGRAGVDADAAAAPRAH